MAVKRSATEAFYIMLGESAERIDLVRKRAEEMRACWLASGWDPTAVWEPPESDSDLDQTEDLPMTPPKSPQEVVVPKAIVVNNFENQQSFVVSNQTPAVSSTSSPTARSRARKRRLQAAVATSRRSTRSTAPTELQFCELGPDGKTSQPLPDPNSSSFRSPRSPRSPRAVKPPPNRRSKYRIQKR